MNPRCVVTKTTSSGETASFAPLDESQSASVFRGPVANNNDNSESLGDMLTLKRANPVVEVPKSNESQDSEDEDYNEMCFPFTRANQTIVYEPLDTMQLRSIFRRPFLQTPDMDDRLEKEGLVLRLANAISELDGDDDDDASEEESLPSLLSNSTGESTQAIEWRGLVSENASILDMMS